MISKHYKVEEGYIYSESAYNLFDNPPTQKPFQYGNEYAVGGRTSDDLFEQLGGKSSKKNKSINMNKHTRKNHKTNSLKKKNYSKKKFMSKSLKIDKKGGKTCQTKECIDHKHALIMRNNEKFRKRKNMRYMPGDKRALMCMKWKSGVVDTRNMSSDLIKKIDTKCNLY